MVLLFIYSLIIVAIIYDIIVFGTCFALQFFVSFLVLQSSRLVKERARITLLLLSFECHVAIIVRCLFHNLKWVWLIVSVVRDFSIFLSYSLTFLSPPYKKIEKL